MKRSILVLLGTLAAIGCTSQKSVIVHEEMTQGIATSTQVLWDITNAAIDDDGNPSASKLKPGDWDKLKEANAKLRSSLERLATAQVVTVVAPGGKILDEEQPTGVKPATVQKYIDANPQVFREKAQSVMALVDRMGQAIGKRDLKATYDSAGELDAACESCHQSMWFGK